MSGYFLNTVELMLVFVNKENDKACLPNPFVLNRIELRIITINRSS
jgi:hypothetical protein